LKEEHFDEIEDVSNKTCMPVKMVEMMTISNSKVFINS